MHFLFPSLSVETVFPVSSLHCSSQPAPVGMLEAAPPPLRLLPGGGRGRTRLLGGSAVHGSKLSCWRFPAATDRVGESSRPAGTLALPRPGNPERLGQRGGGAGRLSGGPPARPELPPPPESITTAGRGFGASGARPPPLLQFAYRNETLRAPAVLARRAQSRKPRASARSQTPVLDPLRRRRLRPPPRPCPRAAAWAQLRPVDRITLFLLRYFFKCFKRDPSCPPLSPVPRRNQPKLTAR